MFGVVSRFGRGAVRRGLVSAALALPLSAVAQAATIRVPQDQPTVQAAVDAAADGDVIEVGPGKWTGSVTISGRSGLTLRGRGRAVLDGNGDVETLQITSSAQILVEKLRIENSSGDGIRILDSGDVTVQRCRIRRAVQDGVSVADSADVRVERNALQQIGRDGIRLSTGGEPNASSLVVARNRVRTVGNDGIGASGGNVIIERNAIRIALDDGIDLDTERGRVIGNRVTGTGSDGIEIRGIDNEVEDNRVVGAEDDGIDCKGSDNAIVRNRVARTGDNGIEVDRPDPFGGASGNLLDANVIQRAGGSGVYLGTGENSVINNRASRSAEFDLHDASDSDSNHFDRNRFKSERID